MKRFGIFQPFNLEAFEWRLTAPRDFDSLELFLTPNLSIVLRDIVATRVDPNRSGGQFRIGAYLLQSNDQNKFLREILPQRSDERIASAFKDENISVFFSTEEAEGLYQLFENQQFLCREIRLCSYGKPTDITSLNKADFERVVDWFSAKCVMGLIHFEEYETYFKNMQADMEETAYKRIQEEMRNQQAKSGPTKRSMWIKSGISAALITVGFLLCEWGKKLTDRKSVAGYLWGAVSYVLGVGAGMVGKWFGGQVVQKVGLGYV